MDNDDEEMQVENNEKEIEENFFTRKPKPGVKNNEVTEKTATSNKPKTARVVIKEFKSCAFTKEMKDAEIKVELHRNKNGSTTIKCGVDNKNKVMENLRKHGYEGHSYCTSNERFSKTLIKGLDSSWDPEEIKDDIEPQLMEMPIEIGKIRVDRFTTLRSSRENYDLPIFKLTAEDNKTLKAVMSIKAILHTRVTFEALRKREVTQCYNCYKTGHSQVGGGLNPKRCKKCLIIGPHECEV